MPGLSTRVTLSEHDPACRIVQLRWALDAVEMPVVLPEYAGLVLKRPTLDSNVSNTLAVPPPPPPGLIRL